MSSLNDISHDSATFTAARAQAHLTLLRTFVTVYETLQAQHPLTILLTGRLSNPEQQEAQLNHLLRIADFRYRLYLDLLVSVSHTPRKTWPLPQWDVALMLHAHLLSPVHFANDISNGPYRALSGMIDLPITKMQSRLQNLACVEDSRDRSRWQARFPGLPVDLIRAGYDRRGLAPMLASIAAPEPLPLRMAVDRYYTNKSFQFIPPPPFSLDLVQAVKRQVIFARKITSIYPVDPVPVALLEDSQQRYAKFMNLMRIGAVSAPVPALDIDLFWHTHQLSSSIYLPWCRHHIGRIINHDDTVGTSGIASGLDQTKEAWQQTYNEDYLNPSRGLTFQNANSVPRQQSTADKIPPPNLTPAQRQLWDFDVYFQKDHEQQNYRFMKLNEQLAEANQQIANMPEFPHQAQPEGFIIRLLRATVAEPSPRELALRRRHDILIEINNAQYHHRRGQESSGRRRWPLLVAARGWGDPNSTLGAYNRPSQGTQAVEFPMYAATWYDRKPLGFYDYVSGGDGVGVISGGGASLGGGCVLGSSMVGIVWRCRRRRSMSPMILLGVVASWRRVFCKYMFDIELMRDTET